jgi:hypothetical protein
MKANNNDYYWLSPYFEVTLAATVNTHAIELGDYGPISNIENAISQVNHCEMSGREADRAINKVGVAMATIPERAETCGKDNKEASYIKEMLTLQYKSMVFLPLANLRTFDIDRPLL